jgi:Domain of unknown function (DUF397)
MTVTDAGDRGSTWRKASHSVGNGACIEVSSALGHVSVRDSKDPDGPVLSYSADAFRSFLDAAKRSGLPRCAFPAD